MSRALGRHQLCYVIHRLLAGDDRHRMDVLRLAFGQQSLVSQLHGATCGQHRIDQQQRLSLQARRGNVFDMDVEMLVCWVGILAESGNERIARPVETIEEPLVERKAGSRDLVAITPEESRRNAEVILAKVLSNRKPPYGIAGGLFDTLKESNGDFFKITNDEIIYWVLQFFNQEGYDIFPAAASAAF